MKSDMDNKHCISIIQTVLKVLSSSMKYTYFADLPTDSNYLERNLGIKE